MNRETSAPPTRTGAALPAFDAKTERPGDVGPRKAPTSSRAPTSFSSSEGPSPSWPPPPAGASTDARGGRRAQKQEDPQTVSDSKRSSGGGGGGGGQVRERAESPARVSEVTGAAADDAADDYDEEGKEATAVEDAVTEEDIATMHLCHVLIGEFCELDARLSNRTRMSVSLFQTLAQAFETTHTRASFSVVAAAVHRILCALPPQEGGGGRRRRQERTPSAASAVGSDGATVRDLLLTTLTGAATAHESGVPSDPLLLLSPPRARPPCPPALPPRAPRQLATFLATEFRRRGLLVERLQHGAPIVTDFSDLEHGLDDRRRHRSPPFIFPVLSGGSTSRTHLYVRDREVTLRISRDTLYQLAFVVALVGGLMLFFLVRNVL